MPKVQYKQKPRESWLRDPLFKEWLAIDPSDETKCYCKYCKSSIVAKLYDVQAHAKTNKHMATASCFAQKNKIVFVSNVAPKTKQQEAALCLYIATHSAITPVDHLGILCAKNFGGDSVKLHRTKCTNIIKNVLGPCFLEELKADIGDAQFSLLLDESTDVSVCKYLGKSQIK